MKHNIDDLGELRHVRLEHHPEVVVRLYETYDRAPTGQQKLAYRLTHGGETIFEGEDYGCSPRNPIDSDEALRGLMGFLTLRPGDTDPEYFEGYTPRQLEWAETHGEELSLYAIETSEDEPGLPGFVDVE